MLCTLVSRVLGIVRTRVIASVYGVSSVADVLNFTFNIPNNFRKLFGEGAVNSALIPTFSSLIGRNDRAGRLRLFSLLVTYQILLFIPIVLVSYAFRNPIIALLSDFTSEQIALGGALLPFFMLYLAFISLAAIFNGVLQAHTSFFVAYASPLLFSIAVIGGVITLAPAYGAMAMAYSVVAGGLLQAIVSYAAIRRKGYRFHVALAQRSTPLGAVLKAWVLVSAGMVAQVLTQLVTYRLASSLSVGSVTALANSTIFYQTPYGIFFNAIAAVSLPMLSTAWAIGDKKKMKQVMDQSIADLAILLIPSSIILFFLSQESVSIILQTGRFTAEGASLTALVLRPYLVFMTITAWFSLFLRLGYSSGRYTQMTIVVVVQNVIDILLMFLFLRLGLGIISLPLANGISHALALLVLAVLLRDLYSAGELGTTIRQLVRIGVSTLPLLGAGVLYTLCKHPWYATGSTLKGLGTLVFLGTAALLLQLGSYHIMKIPLPFFRRGRVD
jgi:putative peptidoglycan lipid II flippase